MKKLILLSIIFSMLGINEAFGLFSRRASKSVAEIPAASDNPSGKAQGSECYQNCDCATGLACVPDEKYEKYTCTKASADMPKMTCSK